MEFVELIKSEYLAIIFGGLGGVATAFFTQKVLNKRGLFSYFVSHNRVGVSAQDTVFGDVSVTWNGRAVDHLFLSTIELNNDSLEDYENVVIQTYSDDTRLLTGSTQIIGTPNLLEWTDNYKARLKVHESSKPTEKQKNIFYGQREYLIPVFNRGQKVRITYLNEASSTETPNIWLSATLKGVKVKFKIPQQEIFGVPRPRAAIFGLSIGLLLLFPLVAFVKSSWVIALLAITYGFFVVVPGACALKVYKKARDLIGG